MTSESNFTQKPHLITLNCSGGISLGAYMAGVFYELTKEAVKPNPKIIIDIITGASAGAMSGAIAAYSLLRKDTEQLPQPGSQQHLDPAQNSLLYQAWVEQADIELIDSLPVAIKSFQDGIQATIDSFKDSLEIPFTPEENRRRKRLSVLSGTAIEKIAQLVSNSMAIPQTTQPLALLMTITNLQGLLKEVKFTNSKGAWEKIKTITSAETRQFLFYSGIAPEKRDDMWRKAVDGGRASGAFPVAFPPILDPSNNITSINLKGLSNEYFAPGGDRTLLSNDPQLADIRKDDTHLSFLYTDGGILDNLPIVKGIDLETALLSQKEQAKDFLEFQKEWQDIRKKSNSERLYVYIRPVPVESINSAARLTQGHFTVLDVALSGLTLPKTEYDATQLREIEKRNQIAETKNKLLQELDKECPPNLDKLKKMLDEAIPYRHIDLSPITPAILCKIDRAEPGSKLAQLKQIYTGLQQTEYIKENLKTGNAAALVASDFLGAFGGFFDKRYREHDFLLGRLCGITWLYDNCPSVAIPPEEIDDLVRQITGDEKKQGKKILDRDPTAADLKLSQKIRIARLALRAIRILLIESRIYGMGWILVFGVIKLSLMVVVALLEIVVSLLGMLLDRLGF